MARRPSGTPDLFPREGKDMTDKELKRLSRRELLEMLLTQTEENERLKEAMVKTREKLEERKIIMGEAGSIAEAALKLNGVFDAAQNAAQQYLDSIRSLSENQEQMRQAILRQAKAEAEAIRRDAEAYASKVRGEADRAAAGQKQRVSAGEQDDYWENLLSEAKSLAGDGPKKAGSRREKE